MRKERNPVWLVCSRQEIRLEVVRVQVLRLHRPKSKLSEERRGKGVMELVMLPRMQVRWRRRIDFWFWIVGVSQKVD